MKKVLILYHSRTGFTQRYAQWLGEELQAPCIPLKDYHTGQEAGYDLLLCGGGICGNELEGLKQYRKLQKRNPDKVILYFATGLRPATEDTTALLLRYNFEKDPVPPELYYFSGGLNLDALESKQKALLTGLRSMLGRRRDLQDADLQLLSLLRVSGDYCDRSQILPLVQRLSGGL